MTKDTNSARKTRQGCWEDKRGKHATDEGSARHGASKLCPQDAEDLRTDTILREIIANLREIMAKLDALDRD
jgi:hypothetical protein